MHLFRRIYCLLLGGWEETLRAASTFSPSPSLPSQGAARDGGTALPRTHRCHLRSAKRLRARDALSSVSALAPTRRHVVLTPVQPILFLFKHRCPPHVLTDKGGRAFVSSVLQRSVHVYTLIYPPPLPIHVGHGCRVTMSGSARGPKKEEPSVAMQGEVMARRGWVGNPSPGLLEE